MMEFIIIPLVIGIITLGIYKALELLVRRRERMMIIERLESDSLLEYLKIVPMGLGLPASPSYSYSSGALKIGCLLMGLGLGLLVGYLLVDNMPENRYYRIESAIFGGSVLFFGGLGLIVSFIIERILARKQK